jgi:hypothetical protein
MCPTFFTKQLFNFTHPDIAFVVKYLRMNLFTCLSFRVIALVSVVNEVILVDVLQLNYLQYDFFPMQSMNTLGDFWPFVTINKCALLDPALEIKFLQPIVGLPTESSSRNESRKKLSTGVFQLAL